MSSSHSVVDEQKLIAIYMSLVGCSEAQARSALMYHLEELDARLRPDSSRDPFDIAEKTDPQQPWGRTHLS